MRFIATMTRHSSVGMEYMFLKNRFLSQKTGAKFSHMPPGNCRLKKNSTLSGDVTITVRGGKIAAKG
jgi:hypothetical protein